MYYTIVYDCGIFVCQAEDKLDAADQFWEKYPLKKIWGFLTGKYEEVIK